MFVHWEERCWFKHKEDVLEKDPLSRTPSERNESTQIATLARCVG